MLVPPIVELEPSSGPVLGAADRIVIYGTGGIGKSTLASYLPGPLFLDLDDGTRKMDVVRDRVSDWRALRGKLAAIIAAPPTGVRTVVLDSITKAEERAAEYVVETRRTEKGDLVDSVDSFGWGRGWTFVYDEFCALIADLDRVNAKGIAVCLIAHVVSTPVPNPTGEDFLRWEPMLYPGDKRGKGSVRELVKNWADHMLFLGYDVFVRDNRGLGSGSRTTYTGEMPTHLAKSRTKAVAMPFDISDPGAVWRELGIS